MGPKLLRVDKNGTKYWVDTTCPKCNGKGAIDAYYYNAQGICFLCGGSGQYETQWKEYTPEYEAKLAERRLARARKQAPEKNARFLKSIGFSEDGKTWIVLGKTYDIKEDLKAAGCRWHNLLGWHFDHSNNGFDCFELSIDEVTTLSYAGEYIWNAYSDVVDYVNEKREQYAPEKPVSVSTFIGKPGDKVALKVTLQHVFTYTTHFTYMGELAYIYKFKDEEGNLIIWKTSKSYKINDGWTGEITGTVKEHSEYNDEKQTVLTRCKLKDLRKEA